MHVSRSSLRAGFTCARLFLQYLLHYLTSVRSLVNRHAWSRTPVAETSWALLRDCYHGIMCIRHTPQHIAIATLYLALNTYGVELPVGEKEWWQVCIYSVIAIKLEHSLSCSTGLIMGWKSSGRSYSSQTCSCVITLKNVRQSCVTKADTFPFQFLAGC